MRTCSVCGRPTDRGYLWRCRRCSGIGRARCNPLFDRGRWVPEFEFHIERCVMADGVQAWSRTRPPMVSVFVADERDDREDPGQPYRALHACASASLAWLRDVWGGAA